MDSICEEIKDDMHKIEEDSKKIDCYAILDLILHSFKCFIDSIKYCFKIKYYSIHIYIYIMKRFINFKSYELKLAPSDVSRMMSFTAAQALGV